MNLKYKIGLKVCKQDPRDQINFILLTLNIHARRMDGKGSISCYRSLAQFKVNSSMVIT